MRLVSVNYNGIEHMISGDEIIGRSSKSTIKILDLMVSRTHAKLRVVSDHEVEVEDLGSANGTYINSKRVTIPTLMSRGDELTIGRSVFTIALGGKHSVNRSHCRLC